ncbi:LysR substrate-binding domain-containing protein [Vibrio algarum]|uniref:LysR substrate-binding domain-containing protein n=1 Tax=Vibrio algarum TaxID=3020714 RepID=A0ABT4YVA8_9VIBR|nr:LysR substrate-binding domain-containing protein [Vibrio sp. KJ40-1]MDB1125491.1 LysR substrate-binding domain-containing protein [Vibrio sp. KJ40-1]
MRTLIPLKSIYTFVAVAETGSMTNASDVLNVSHSAVSQAIKSLENQLGQPLFRRIGRHVELNSQGKRYYKKVAPALEQIVDASEALQKPIHSNRVTLNMINSLAVHWWIPRMMSFQETAPNLDVRVSNLVGPFNLENEGVDVALIHGLKDEWQDYYCEKLGDDEMVMVCNPELVSSNTTAESLLKTYPAIYASNDRRKNDWGYWCQEHQLPIPKRRNNLSFVVSVHAVQAAISKLGIFVTHRQFVKDDIKLGLLVEVGKPVKHPSQSFYFACQPDKLKLESVLTLRSWLRKEFA